MTSNALALAQKVSTLVSDSGASTTTYANTTDLPTAEVTTGAMAYVSANNKLYMWNGSAWFNIAIVNQAPTAITGNQASYVLATDGTPTVVTLVSTDPEGFPLTWSSSASGDTQVGTLSQTDNVFTITPSTDEADIGTLSVTFSVTDGTNTETSVSLFTLAFTSPYWNETVLSIGTSSTNGLANSTFIDRSTNAHTVTPTGSPLQTAFHPYLDNWSFTGNGTDNYLVVDNTSGDLSLGTSDFTIEAWINFTSMPAGNGYPSSAWLIGGGLLNSNTGLDVAFGSTNLQVALTNFLSLHINIAHNLTTNQWYHFALVRSGTSLTAYINGIQLATTTTSDSVDPLSTGLAISAAEPSGSTDGNFPGYISNLRILKGTALYTSSFTAPSQKLAAITNTVLLTCQSNRFIDNSLSPKTITVNGSSKISAFNPFGQESEYAAGENKGSVVLTTNKYLTAPSNTAFAVGTGDFTLEAWVYVFSAPGGGVDFDLNLFGGFNFTPVFFLYIHNTNLKPTLWNGSAGATSEIAVVPKSWNHVVYSRSANTLRIFVNGEIGYEASYTTNWTSPSTVFIGKSDTNSTRYFNGHIADLKFTKGTALYTSAFTPPTAPVGNTNASLYLPMDNAGIFDKTGNNILTPVGNASTSTTQTKYANTAMYFDGSGDYLVTNGDQSQFTFGTGDFTIEGWAYFNNLTTTGTIYDSRPTSTNGAYILIDKPGASDKLRFYTQSAARIESDSTLSASTWYHFALVRASGFTKMYIDGTAQSTTYTDTNSYLNPENRPLIGNGGFNLLAPLNGYLENLQILKGVAKYTANFTPPNRTQGIGYQAES